MFRTEQYRTVDWSVKHASDWPLLTILLGLAIKDWPEVIERVFKTACEWRDDERAALCFEFLMQAVENVELAPHLTPEESGRVGEMLLACNEQVQGCREAARKNKSQWAVKLYAGLPTHERGSMLVQYDMDDHRQTPIKRATLLKTREKILAQITVRWGHPEDEGEADTLFGFLATQLGLARFDEEKKVILGAIRKETDSCFPTHRLTRHILWLVGQRWHRSEEVFAVLLIARARNVPTEVAFQELSVLQHLEVLSSHGFRFLEGFAAKLALLDGKVRKLLGQMQPNGIFHKDFVYGEIVVNYSNSDSGPLGIVIEQDNDRRRQSQLEDYGHKQFEIARDHVLAWKAQAEYPGNMVLLLRITERHPDREMFRREQVL